MPLCYGLFFMTKHDNAIIVKPGKFSRSRFINVNYQPVWRMPVGDLGTYGSRPWDAPYRIDMCSILNCLAEFPLTISRLMNCLRLLCLHGWIQTSGLLNNLYRTHFIAFDFLFSLLFSCSCSCFMIHILLGVLKTSDCTGIL